MASIVWNFLFILALIFLQTSATITDLCMFEQKFDETYAENLGQAKLKDLFLTSPNSLGNGAFGVVKQIDWKNANGEVVPVAVKQIILIDIEQYLPLVEHEIKVMKALMNSNSVVQMKDCMINKETIMPGTQIGNKMAAKAFKTIVVYIVIEKLYASFEKIPKLGDDAPNKTLRAKSTLERIKIYLKLAEALRTLHVNNYVHSDLKPANVMTTGKDLEVIKLIDLGFANEINGNFIGSTPIYKPIEGWLSQPLQASFDTYAFAMTVAALELPEGRLGQVATPHYAKKDKHDFVESLIKEIKIQLPKIEGFGSLTDKEDNFSKVLIECAAYRASNRPGDFEIVRRIKAYIEVLEKNTNLSGVRNAAIKSELKANALVDNKVYGDNERGGIDSQKPEKQDMSMQVDIPPQFVNQKNAESQKLLTDKVAGINNFGLIIGLSLFAIVTLAILVPLGFKHFNSSDNNK